MRNPYEVLGIKEGASKDEIRSAYKNMAKKYHPDQYGNNPLKDLAEEKMRELNEAFDYLMANSNSDNFNSTTYSSNTGYTDYNSVRQDIRNGNYNNAINKLNNISTHDAEWNFLMGNIYMRQGWYDRANSFISAAYNMEPNNSEYRDAYNSLNSRNNNYRQNYYNRGYGNNSDFGDLCCKLWCADQCCECMGGDLINCC